MSWDNRFLSTPAVCVRIIFHPLCWMSSSRFQSVPPNSPAERAATGIIPALEANHTTKTLSHGINYSNLSSLQWMPAPGGGGKIEADLWHPPLFPLLSRLQLWLTVKFCSTKIWDLVHVAHMSSSSYRKSPLKARELAQEQVFLSWEKVAGSDSNLFDNFFIVLANTLKRDLFMKRTTSASIPCANRWEKKFVNSRSKRESMKSSIRNYPCHVGHFGEHFYFIY